MLKRLGFFRLACDPDDERRFDYRRPVEDLDSALIRANKAGDEVDSSLIVLPEAFNNCKYYWDSQPEVDWNLAERLKGTAQRFGVTLVAGLLEQSQIGLPYSSCYLIEPSDQQSRRLCRKVRPDNSNHYQCCEGDCDNNNPLVLTADVCVGALLCCDIEDGDRIRRLNSCFVKHGKSLNILCIPACMRRSVYSSTEAIASEWPTNWVASR